ncbi:hypothetical protein BGZ96_012020, partial [Linnemannia gamsii]
MSMAGNTPEGTGHVGTLTPNQATALKQLWAALYEIQANGTVTLTHDPKLNAPPAPAVEAAPVAAGWGGGWFGSAAPAAPVEPVAEPPLTVTLEEVDLSAAD